MATDRFDRLTALTPRRFHMIANPPYGVGLVLCGHVNEEEVDDTGSQFFRQRDGIKSCKPGIWTSMTRQVGEPGDDFSVECILRWVEAGTIDISQPVKDWEAYEKETREKDLEVKMSEIVPKGTKWRKAGSYYDDGGVCSVISTEYLTKDAAKKIMFGAEGEEEEIDFGFYTETLTLNGWEMSAGANERFTIGGMNFGQDEVGGPPVVALAEENGQVIAVRLYRGSDDDEDRSEGAEEGFSSDEDMEKVKS